MATLRIFYEYVNVNKLLRFGNFNSRAAIPNDVVISGTSEEDGGCRGIVYQVNLRQDDPDQVSFIDVAKLEKDRRARGDIVRVQSGQGDFDQVIPFDAAPLIKHEGGHPLTAPEKSIAALKLIRPKSVKPNEVKIGSGRTVKITGEPPKIATFDVLLDTTEFILEQANEQMTEKFQIHETFGEPVVFMFGKRAEIFSYSGTLLNSSKHPWRSIFIRNYEEVLRGTKAVEAGARAFLLYDDIIREGLVLSVAMSQSSVFDNIVKFSMNMVVFRKKNLDSIPALPTNPNQITRKTKGQNISNLDDIAFVRQLPALTPNDGNPLPFSELSIPGFEDPKDSPEGLKRVLQNKALSALSRVQREQDLGEKDNITEETIFLDFIPEISFPPDLVRVLTKAGSLGGDIPGQLALSELIADKNNLDKFTFPTVTRLVETLKQTPGLVDPSSVDRASQIISNINKKTVNPIGKGTIGPRDVFSFIDSAKQKTLGQITTEGQQIIDYVEGFERAGLTEITDASLFQLFELTNADTEFVRALMVSAGYGMLGSNTTGTGFISVLQPDAFPTIPQLTPNAIEAVRNSKFSQIATMFTGANRFFDELRSELNVVRTFLLDPGNTFMQDNANFGFSLPAPDSVSINSAENVPILDDFYVAHPATPTEENILRFLRGLQFYITTLVNELISKENDSVAPHFDIFIGFTLPDDIDGGTFEFGTQFLTTGTFSDLVTNMRTVQEKDIDYIAIDREAVSHSDSDVAGNVIQMRFPSGFRPADTKSRIVFIKTASFLKGFGLQQRIVRHNVVVDARALPPSSSSSPLQQVGIITDATIFPVGDISGWDDPVLALGPREPRSQSVVYKALTRGNPHKSLIVNGLISDSDNPNAIIGPPEKWNEEATFGLSGTPDDQKIRNLNLKINSSGEFRFRRLIGGKRMFHTVGGIGLIDVIFDNVRGLMEKELSSKIARKPDASNTFDKDIMDILNNPEDLILFGEPSQERVDQLLSISNYNTIPSVQNILSILSGTFGIETVKITDYYNRVLRQNELAKLLRDLRAELLKVADNLATDPKAEEAREGEKRLNNQLCSGGTI